MGRNADKLAERLYAAVRFGVEKCDEAGDCPVIRGNFHGVCPTIGRLRKLYERISPKTETTGQRKFCRFDFLARE